MQLQSRLIIFGFKVCSNLVFRPKLTVCLCTSARIVDPQGNRVGFDYVSGEIVNEILGALYNGPDTEPQLISISEPLNGDYTILLSGTGTGTYSLTVELSARAIIRERRAHAKRKCIKYLKAIYHYWWCQMPR